MKFRISFMIQMVCHKHTGDSVSNINTCSMTHLIFFVIFAEHASIVTIFPLYFL